MLQQKHMIYYSGNSTRNVDFKFGENTDVFGGCGALFEDKMMYFGGFIRDKQVS